MNGSWFPKFPLVGSRLRPRPRRGVVLVLVLGAVALLTLLAVELSHRAGLDVARAARSGRDTAYRRLFDAGLELARGLLTEGRTNKGEGFDSWGEGWNQTLRTELGAGEVLEVRMADEAGKVNLLALGNGNDQGAAAKARKTLGRVFEFLRRREPERLEDWKAAERMVLERLGLGTSPAPVAQASSTAKPFPKKAVAPLYTLDGLREEGLSLERVFGKPEGGPPRLALSDLFTTFGDGVINVNTAPEAVLYALDEEWDEGLVGEVCAWRGARVAGEAGRKPRPFRRAQELERVPGMVQRVDSPNQSQSQSQSQTQVIKNLFLKVQSKVGVRSRSFSARLRASVEGRTHEGWGFFEVTDGAPPRLVAFEELEP